MQPKRKCDWDKPNLQPTDIVSAFLTHFHNSTCWVGRNSKSIFYICDSSIDVCQPLLWRWNDLQHWFFLTRFSISLNQKLLKDADDNFGGLWWNDPPHVRHGLCTKTARKNAQKGNMLLIILVVMFMIMTKVISIMWILITAMHCNGDNSHDGAF